MRKFSTKLILILLVGSLVLPIFPVIAKPTPAAIPTFKIGVTGGAMGSWDSTIASAGFAGADYGPTALETLMLPPIGWDGDYDTMIPVLATQMDIIEWPEEPNTLGWINTGGIQAIDFTLRSGVTFHDGSAFNATVAKWNIDRMFVITGNLTGELTWGMLTDEMYKALYSYWLPATTWAPYETATWNVSQFFGQPAAYAEYGATQTPMTGWLYWYFFDSVYPRIKNVTILDDQPSGGKIRVNFNDWSGVMTYVDDAMMISMDAYKDYFDLPIYGLGDVSGFEQPDVTGGYPTTGFPGHLIGTGPYRFIEHDEVLQQGIMERYDDWWNSTAMQANGWHQVPELAIVTFPYSDAGFALRSTAMVTGTIDYALDDGTLVYTDMIAAPDINYIEGGIGSDRTFITLNGINETYWKDFADMGPAVFNASDPYINETLYGGPVGDLSHMVDIDDDGTIHVDGINRAMRKAVSYAFDYDTYIDVVLGGRAVRSGGFLGLSNEYYNPSIPLADHDLTIARQALLDDPYWSLICTDRGLTVANLTNDDDWTDVANTNPIFEFKLLWDMATYDLASVMGNSIKDIGLSLGGLNGAPDGTLLVQPDVYTVLFSGNVGTVPWFTCHGTPTSWPGTDIDFIPALEYYVKSPGIPYEWWSYSCFPYTQLINLGFHYNDTVDKWVDRGWFSDRTTNQELMDNMTRHFQTYQYSDIMISHSMWGIAIDEDWEYSSILGYQFLKYLPGEADDEGVPIPGFQTAVILAIAIVTITGIGYSLNRKRKRA